MTNSQSETADERRARELMLNPADRAAYLRLMAGERGEYTVVCPDCRVRVQTYEGDIWKHLKGCQALRVASGEQVGPNERRGMAWRLEAEEKRDAAVEQAIVDAERWPKIADKRTAFLATLEQAGYTINQKRGAR